MEATVDVEVGEATTKSAGVAASEAEAVDVTEIAMSEVIELILVL